MQIWKQFPKWDLTYSYIFSKKYIFTSMNNLVKSVLLTPHNVNFHICGLCLVTLYEYVVQMSVNRQSFLSQWKSLQTGESVKFNVNTRHYISIKYDDTNKILQIKKHESMRECRSRNSGSGGSRAGSALYRQICKKLSITITIRYISKIYKQW